MCPSDIYIADRLTRTCYRVDWSKQKWISARDACAANGERLVVLEPVTKAEFIRDFLNANKGKPNCKTKVPQIVKCTYRKSESCVDPQLVAQFSDPAQQYNTV